jgi:heme exporter protein A
VLLDEPETGLDQYAGEMLLEVLDGLNPGKLTVVMTTHNLQRGLEIGNHIIILAEGKIAYEESNQSLNLASLQEAYYHYTGITQ